MAYKGIPTAIPNRLRINGTFQRADDQIYGGYRLGVPLPGWRQKVQAQQNATTDMYLNAIRLDGAVPLAFNHIYEYAWGINPGETIQYGTSVQGYWYNSNHHDISHVVAALPEDDNQALARLYGKIRAHSYGVNGPLILGELKETLLMLRRPASALRDSVSTLLDTIRSNRIGVQRTIKPRRGESQARVDVRRRNAVKNGIAGSVLEAKFGWAPLISDTRDILEEATRQILGLRLQATRINSRSDLRGGSHLQVNTSDTPIINQNLRHSVIRHLETKAQVAYSCGMASQLTGPSNEIDYLFGRLGFQVQNFIPTIYELLPWSFLIDYFVNIGDILEAACTNVSSVTWQKKTVYQETQCSIIEHVNSVNVGSGQGSYRTVSLSGKASSNRHITRKTITRSKLDSLPLPTFQLTIPGSNEPKWLNMAALLAQARDYKFKG